MPNVSVDGQSFSVRGRRIWLSAVEFEYSLTPHGSWRQRLHAAADAGFNAIVTRVPWFLHEPRPGSFQFEGDLAVGDFLRLAGELGLFVVARIGPCVGGTFDGGGVPPWLSDLEGTRVREANPTFLERVTKWFQAVGAHVVPHQATVRPKSGGRALGPVVAVGVEDDWACDASAPSAAYLNELVRYAREIGIEVPILTANNAWTSVEAAVDVWSGWDELAATTRQLGAVRPGHPRIVAVRATDGRARLGARPPVPERAAQDDVARRLCEVVAGGGQFVLADGFATTHSALTQGSDVAGPFATTTHPGLVWDASGEMRKESATVRRVASFASSFGHVLAQMEPKYQSVLLDPASPSGVAVASLTGSGGTAVFAFANGRAASHRTVGLILPDGRRLDAHLGDAPVSWFLIDVDLLGVGRLDHSTICPVALLDRAFLVFVGPPGAHADLSINGIPLAATVPTGGEGSRPVVERLRELTVVVCNPAQFESMRHRAGELVFERRAGDSRAKAVRVQANGAIGSLGIEPVPAVPPPRPVQGWIARPANDLVDGTSSRYATIDAPASLTACGVRESAGWYRATFRRSSAGNVLLHAPQAADRVTLWLDGVRLGTFGDGPGASAFPVRLRLGAGEHRLVALAERLGRPVSGEHVARPSGLYGPLLEVAPLKVAGRRARGVSVDRFALAGFVYGISEGDIVPGEAVTWTIPPKHRRSVLVDASELRVTGTLVANGSPLARVSVDGTRDRGITVEHAREIQFVFDVEPDEAAYRAVAAAVRLYAVGRPIGGSHAFARWTPPATWSERTGQSSRGATRAPTWRRGTVSLRGEQQDRWLRLGSAGDGVAFVNGRCVGRFACRTPTGKATGGASSLFVPRQWLHAGDNEVVLFDLFGTEPAGVTL